jgi:hypothetical protein
MHVLVAGWFSFEHMGNTAGDMIACDVVTSWLHEAGVSHEVAVAAAFSYKNKVDINAVNPASFTDVVFVCGPFANGRPITDLLKRFGACRLTGINVSVLESLDSWNPFSLLFERDSSRAANPDITFIAPKPKVPVVGIILAHKQKEYGNAALHEKANEFIGNLINSREMSVVRIDTALENNKGGLRTPGEIESIIARMDVVVTTRLHGTVLALKNGVPVIAIDPIANGAKIARQVATFGWPVLLQTDLVKDGDLLNAFDYCLTAEAKSKAIECAQIATQMVRQTKQDFIRNFSGLKP